MGHFISYCCFKDFANIFRISLVIGYFDTIIAKRDKERTKQLREYAYMTLVFNQFYKQIISPAFQMGGNIYSYLKSVIAADVLTEQQNHAKKSFCYTKKLLCYIKKSFRYMKKSFRYMKKSFRYTKKSLCYTKKSLRYMKKSFCYTKKLLRYTKKSFCYTKKSFRYTKKSFRYTKKSLCYIKKSFRYTKKSFCYTKKSFRYTKKSFRYMKKSFRYMKELCVEAVILETHYYLTYKHNRYGWKNYCNKVAQY
jgi:hypothetical protein